MTDFDLRPSLAGYLRSIADWRRNRYQDDLRDPRNLVSAAGLDGMATWIMTLPEDDPRIATLSRYASEGDSFTPDSNRSTRSDASDSSRPKPNSIHFSIS